jgi:hypothetical protein
MPYLKKFEKAHLDQLLCGVIPLSPGQLNFCVTRLCQMYLKHVGKNYETLNAVIGALECAKHEIFRRAISGYEDEAIKRNGDVYPQ